MRKILYILLACLVASCGSSHYNSKNNATKATIYDQTNGTFIYNLPCKVTNIHQEKPGKSILLLWLHGGVHDKTLHDLSKFNHLDCCNADDSLLTYLENKGMKAIVLMPVCHKAALDHSVDWKQCYDDVKAIMDDLINKQLVDTNRIYLVGYSYGGDGAYALACHYPGTFAAVLTIASVTPHPEYVSREHPGSWWNVSNCAEYTGCDRMLAELEAFRDKVNGFGGDFRVGTYPSGGHDAWTAIWKDAKMWDWMFSKSLAAKPVRKKDGQVGRVPLSLAGMACTATVPGKSPLCGPAQAVDGLSATCYVPERPFVRSDAWTLALDRSLTGTLRVTFGDLKGRDVPRDALVETSSDGRNWKRLGSAKDCTRPCEFPLRGHVRHIRLRPVSKNPTPFAIRAVEAFGAWR